LCNKIDEFSATISSINDTRDNAIDVIVITESWLRDDVSDSIISLRNYISIRDDRSNRRGGGVILYIKSTITHTVINVEDKPNDIECIVIYLHTFKAIMCTTYIPPNLNVASKNAISEYIIFKLDYVSSLFQCDNFILCGDFNDFNLINICATLDLTKLINCGTTRSGSCLDNFIVSAHMSTSYHIPTATPPIGSSYHLTIILEPKLSSSQVKERVTFLDLRQSNIDKFCAELAKCDFTSVYNEANVDQKCVAFYDIMYMCLSVIPSSTVYMSSSDKPWITPLIKLLINKRWTAFRSNNRPLYYHYKTLVISAISSAKINWAKKQCSTTTGMWGVVKQHTSGNTTNTALESVFSAFVTKEEALDAINLHFGSVYKSNSCVEPFIKSDAICETQWIPPLSDYNTYQMLNNLKTTKSTGGDSILNKLYIAASPFIATPLSIILNSSILQCTVPRLFKCVDVAAKPKVSKPSINQLRLISLLCVPNQLLESHILTHMKSHLIEKIDDAQYAYIPGSSATCALLQIQHTVVNILDDNNNIGCIILSFDFSKAFDCVNHNLLIGKLISFELPAEFITWCKSYLSNRCQRVRHGNITSDYINCYSGVPQGSKIGPLLYLLYTTDILPADPNNKCVKFADDTEFILPVTKQETNCIISHRIKKEMEHIQTIADQLNLKLNCDKTKVLPIYRQNAVCTVACDYLCESMRLLGVIFNNKLTWNDHFLQRIKLCNQRVFAIKIIKQILPRNALIVIYKQLVLSILEYANPIFLNLPDNVQCKINSVQKRCHNVIDGPNCKCNDFPNLTERRLSQSMLLFTKAKCYQHKINNMLFNVTRTCTCINKIKCNCKIILPHCNTSRRMKAFSFTCSAEYNSTVASARR
jgi:hypothetical protein